MKKTAKPNNSEIRILVVCDNFLVGGRETFLDSYLKALSLKIDLKVALLAQRIENSRVDDIFSCVYKVPHDSGSSNTELASWLRVSNESVESFKPDILWVQHFCLLPACLVSLKFSLPVLCTMHGSLLSEGKLKRVNDILGFAFLLQHQGEFSAVSEEVRQQIISASENSEKDIPLIVNAVEIPEIELIDKRNILKTDELHIILLTRRQKLGHIRAAIKFFVEIVKVFPSAKLTIHTQLSNSDVGSKQGQRHEFFSLLGRKWVLKNLAVYAVVNKIKFKPFIVDTATALSNSDVVLGMGRVVLEGIALNKPTILIGYEKPIAIVDETNFIELQKTNFSGRNQISQSNKRIVSSMKYRIDEPDISPDSLMAMVNIKLRLNPLVSVITRMKNNGIDFMDSVEPEVKLEITRLFDKAIQTGGELTVNDITLLKKSLAGRIGPLVSFFNTSNEIV